MYKLFTRNKKVEKRLQNYVEFRKDISEKLKRLLENPRRACGAHPLHGRLRGKWSCWIGANLRIVYEINDIENKIIVESIGGHKIY